jgi:hypothetical protein
MSRFCALAAALLLLPALFAADAPSKGDQTILDLYKSGGLFDRKQYKAVRAAFARAFEEKHADTLRAAFGDDHAVLTAWLNKKPEVKEELFTALSEEHDDLTAALKLFAGLWKEYPDKIEPFAQLAIAVSVTWDRPNLRRYTTDPLSGVYDYTHHQTRTKSTLPGNLADGKANFDYLINGGNQLSSIKQLPWEFLLFVVDHRTPVEERKWAQNYVKTRRGKVSSWHQDVPYDKGMLQTEVTGKGPGPKLAGQEYTLANIKRCGGVCAQQADFVARVGKSVGQPSMYVSGESSYRGWHAWVMWVNVFKAGKDSPVRYSLVSDGRTRGFERDLFYVGYLTDPQTGERILDRDMERRFAAMASDPLARRQSKLVMRAYPNLVKEAGLGVKERIEYLDRCLLLSPLADEPWLEFAKMARESELTDSFKPVAAAKLTALTKSFAKHPDFIARLSDDLLTAESTAAKIKHYQREYLIHEKAARADLACNTALKVAQQQQEQKRYKEAAQTLSAAVKKFPAEGRYIPGLLKAYEGVCENHPQGVSALGKLYLDLAPALVLHYRGEKNKFLDLVLSQATSFFEEKKLDRLAATFKTRVAQAKARAATVK